MTLTWCWEVAACVETEHIPRKNSVFTCARNVSQCTKTSSHTLTPVLPVGRSRLISALHSYCKYRPTCSRRPPAHGPAPRRSLAPNIKSQPFGDWHGLCEARDRYTGVAVGWETSEEWRSFSLQVINAWGEKTLWEEDTTRNLLLDESIPITVTTTRPHCVEADTRNLT